MPCVTCSTDLHVRFSKGLSLFAAFSIFLLALKSPCCDPSFYAILLGTWADVIDQLDSQKSRRAYTDCPHAREAQ